MPVTAKVNGMHPAIAQRLVLDLDPSFDHWIFCASGVHQWDWNGLLTEEEYLDYVLRSPNLLGVTWRASSKAYKMNDPRNQEKPFNMPSSKSHEQEIYESVQQQAKLKKQREQP